jgi:hypothetical protein
LSGNTGNAGHGLKVVRNTIEEEEEEEEEEDVMMMMMMVVVVVVVKMVKNKTLLHCWKQMIIAWRQIPLTESQLVVGSLVMKLYGM